MTSVSSDELHPYGRFLQLSGEPVKLGIMHIKFKPGEFTYKVIPCEDPCMLDSDFFTELRQGKVVDLDSWPDHGTLPKEWYSSTKLIIFGSCDLVKYDYHAPKSTVDNPTTYTILFGPREKRSFRWMLWYRDCDSHLGNQAINTYLHNHIGYDTNYLEDVDEVRTLLTRRFRENYADELGPFHARGRTLRCQARDKKNDDRRQCKEDADALDASEIEEYVMPNLFA